MNGAEGMNQRSRGGRLAAGWRLGLTLFLLSILAALSRCSPAATSGAKTATATTATGHLRIAVRPHGARVSIDGLRSGQTPVSAELPAGSHTIRVEEAGYEPLVQTVALVAGEEIVLEGQLTPLESATERTIPTAATSPPTPAPTLPDLVVSQVKIEVETRESCTEGLAPLGVRVFIENAGGADAGPFVIEINDARLEVPQGLPAGEKIALWTPGYVAGAENRVLLDAASQVQESDEENNLFSQMVPIPTPLPTCTPPAPDGATDTPPPSPTPTPTSPPPAGKGVTVHQGQITIPTYPYRDFLREARNATFNMTYQVLDWTAYEASNPTPTEVTYRTLVLENEYLRLTFLPEVGGRLYDIFYKPTGHSQTYHNPVLKPSPWGPAEQGWWLAAGGIEWCLPVEEHGYEWGTPWQVSTHRDVEGVTVLLRDSQAQDRVRAEIAVRLEAGTAAFSLRPRLENPTGAPLSVKYWTNAMLAPGGRNAPSADLRFVLPEPVTTVTVHSRGDDDLPGYNQPMPWPIVEGRDLSRLGNWNRWLGFFEDPAHGAFMAVYDEGYDEGMVRAFPAERVLGAKVFAFGWTDPIPARNWTDDGSSYVEIHGGPAPTFDHSTTLPAGGSLQWTETWYPVAGLGELCFANATAALNLSTTGSQVQLDVVVPRSWSGHLLLLVDGQAQWQQEVNLQPGRPFRTAVSLGDSLPLPQRLAVRLEQLDGEVVAEVRADRCDAYLTP